MNVAFRSSNKIRHAFRFKDQIPKYMNSKVIYKFKCNIYNDVYIGETKADITLHDLDDTTCMTHHWFSDRHCIYTIIQVVHTKFIKLVHREYTDFKNLSKIIQEQAAAAVIIALISENNKSKEKKQKGRVYMKPWLKRRKT